MKYARKLLKETLFREDEDQIGRYWWNYQIMMGVRPLVKDREERKFGQGHLRPPYNLEKNLPGLSGVLVLRVPIRRVPSPRNWLAQPPCHSQLSSHGKCSLCTESGQVFRGQLLGLPSHRLERHILRATTCKYQTLISVMCFSLFLEGSKLEFLEQLGFSL